MRYPTHHLSFRALEYLASKHGMKLKTVGGGRSFGIVYHLAVLLYPIPTRLLRRMFDGSIRAFIAIKAAAATIFQLVRRKVAWTNARQIGRDYYVLECLRQSTGFEFVMERLPLGANPPPTVKWPEFSM